MKIAPLAVASILIAAAVLSAACSDRQDEAGNGASPSPSEAGRTATAGATATGAATSTRTASPGSANGRAEGPAEFEGSRALEHIRQLASVIGPRVSGGPAEETTVDYLAKTFESYGYSVERYAFTFDTDPFRTASLTAEGKAYTSYAMTGSGSGQVTAKTAFVGLADDAGIAGQDLKGRIAVADRGELRFSAKLENVKAAGAIALVVINNQPGEFVGNLTGGSTLPAVTVSDTAGETIRALARRGGELTVNVPGGSATGSVDVIARPSADSECRVLVGGHHDTVPGAPGAHDNGSGTGAVLELARAFAADGLDEGLCFVTFGAEESGLNGSRALAARLKAEGSLPAYMVNIDANGVGTRVNLIGTPSLTSRAQAVGLQLGIEADVTELGAQFGSDHQSFEAEGVPVLFFTSDSLGFIHTPEDTFDTLSPAVVEQGGDLAYAMIKELVAGVGAR